MSCGEPWLTPQEFLYPADRALFLYMQAQATVAPPAKMWDSLDEFLQQRIEQLLALPLDETQPQPERWLEVLLLSILDWRLAAANKQNRELKQLLKEAQAQTDNEAITLYTQQHLELSALIRRINHAKGAITGLKRRRPTR
jgi:hypothetical protein